MRYWTSYYREDPEETALTLQQATRIRGRISMALACVCGEDSPGGGFGEGAGAGEAFCLGLTDWFHGRVLAGRGPEPDFEAYGRELDHMARGGGFSAAGILCVRDRFLLFYRGEQRILMIHTRFLRSGVRRLSSVIGQGEKLGIKMGCLEPGVGIVCGTEGFFRGLGDGELGGCLSPGAIGSRRQAAKRLTELGRYGGSGSRESCGAGEEGKSRPRAAVFVLGVHQDIR